MVALALSPPSDVDARRHITPADDTIRMAAKSIMSTGIDAKSATASAKVSWHTAGASGIPPAAYRWR